jgi:anti-sigma-K factor RskA
LSPNLHTLAGAYSLDALVGVERRRFETHLTECTSCLDEVREMRETATRLATAVNRMPPAELRERVLAEIARTRQLPPRLGRAGARPGRRLYQLAAAACLVLALVSGVVAVRSYRANQHTEALNRQIAAVLAAPDARTVTAPVRPSGNGTVVASRSLGKAVVVMSGLPSLAPSQTYELWLMGPKPPRPAGTMRPPAGPVLAAGLGDATQIGITVEPSGGSAQPTSTPVFAVTLS